MREWEKDLRERYAGERAWTHPDAAEITKDVLANFPGMPMTASRLLEYIVSRESHRRYVANLRNKNLD